MKRKTISLIVLLLALPVFVVYYYLNQQTKLPEISEPPEIDESLVKSVVLDYIKTNNITSESPIVRVSGVGYQYQEDIKIITYHADVYFKSAQQPTTGVAFDYYSAEIDTDSLAITRFQKEPTCVLEKVTDGSQALEAVKNQFGKLGSKVYLMNDDFFGCRWEVRVGKDTYKVQGDGTVRFLPAPVPLN